MDASILAPWAGHGLTMMSVMVLAEGPCTVKSCRFLGHHSFVIILAGVVCGPYEPWHVVGGISGRHSVQVPYCKGINSLTYALLAACLDIFAVYHSFLGVCPCRHLRTSASDKTSGIRHKWPMSCPRAKDTTTPYHRMQVKHRHEGWAPSAHGQHNLIPISDQRPSCVHSTRYVIIQGE